MTCLIQNTTKTLTLAYLLEAKGQPWQPKDYKGTWMNYRGCVPSEG